MIAGHGRCETLTQKKVNGNEAPEGITTEDGEWLVPVDYVTVPPDEEYAAAIALNRITELGGWDDQTLADVLTDLAAKGDEGFDGIGYGQEDLDDLLQQITPPIETDQEAPEPKVDEIDELRELWGTKAGQLWTIGPHRLLCGDSTKEDDVVRLMDGQRAVLFATDPPYLVDYDGTNKPVGGKDWTEHYHDVDASETGEGLYDGFISLAVKHAITQDAAWYCWHASARQAMVEQAWQAYGAFVHQQIVWVKTGPVFGYAWYMWQHEPCFFGWIRGNKPERRADDHPTTVWTFPARGGDRETLHPTSKPVELFEIPILQHTRQGELCYEPFAGSGSQLVAAVRQNRICYGMEREPGFVAVILQRLSDMGQEPRLAGETDS